MRLRRKSVFPACLFQKHRERWKVMDYKTLYYLKRRKIKNTILKHLLVLFFGVVSLRNKKQNKSHMLSTSSSFYLGHKRSKAKIGITCFIVHVCSKTSEFW